MSDSTPGDGLEALNQPSPQDVVGAIIAYSGVATFPSDRRRIHDFIRAMKQDPENRPVLVGFVFSEGADLYPFSRTLENTLVHLQLGGILFAKNPEFEMLGMTPEARDKMKESAANRFDDAAQSALERIGQQFAETFQA